MSDVMEPRVRRRIGRRSENGRISVTRTVYGADTGDEETIEVPFFEAEPARISVKGGITKNMGDYNSIRVDVEVVMPCYPVKSEIDRAYDACSRFIDEYLSAELSKAQGEEPQDDG